MTREYKTLTAATISALSAVVKQHLKADWELHAPAEKVGDGLVCQIVARASMTFECRRDTKGRIRFYAVAGTPPLTAT